MGYQRRARRETRGRNGTKENDRKELTIATVATLLVGVDLARARALTCSRPHASRYELTKFSSSTAVDLNLLNLLNLVASTVVVNLMLRSTYLHPVLNLN